MELEVWFLTPSYRSSKRTTKLTAKGQSTVECLKKKKTTQLRHQPTGSEMSLTNRQKFTMETARHSNARPFMHSPVIARWTMVRANGFAVIKELNQTCDISGKRETEREREREGERKREKKNETPKDDTI